MASVEPSCPVRKIVLASRNRGKVREIAAVLGRCGAEVIGLHDLPAADDIPEPPETGASFAANARNKAACYARATGLCALADDSGLVVDALGGKPGVHSARYAVNEFPAAATRAQTDEANNARLLRELAGVPDESRTARFVCCLALSDGRETLLEATGVVEGMILRRGRGQDGFGYDPLFLVVGTGLTAAEMQPQQKNAISHRGLATRELARRLEQMLASQREGRDHA